VDLNTGEIVIFDETTPQDDIASVITASASIPIIFPPVITADNKVLVDGGTFSNLDMSEAIIKCKDKGFKEEDIIIDVIMCFDKVVEIPEWTKRDTLYKNAWELF
jgi:predicted acylesterase/phospholipase RssA